MYILKKILTKKTFPETLKLVSPRDVFQFLPAGVIFFCLYLFAGHKNLSLSLFSASISISHLLSPSLSQMSLAC